MTLRRVGLVSVGLRRCISARAAFSGRACVPHRGHGYWFPAVFLFFGPSELFLVPGCSAFPSVKCRDRLVLLAQCLVFWSGMVVRPRRGQI